MALSDNKPMAAMATGARLRLFGAARWRVLLATGLLAVLGVAFLAQSAILYNGKLYFSLADDAMISMTYAKNLAHGAGLVWVPGERPVEGFTNPLWTVWMAVVHLVTPVDRWAPLLTALSGLGCLIAGLFAANRIATRLGLTPAGRTFALLAAATLYAPIFWTLRGFEVGVLIAIQGWMLALALEEEDRGLRGGLVLGGLAAVAFLTRMDSLVMSGAILSLRLVGLQWPKVRSALVAGGVLAAAAIALFLARLGYYGDLLPNTVYLKLESVSLIVRLRQGVAADYHALFGWTPLILLAALPVFLLKKSARAQRTAYLGVVFVIGAQFAYAAYVGGDAWEWSGFQDRFVSLIAFPLCVAAGCGFGELLQRLNLSRRAGGLATAAATLLAFGWTSFGDWRETLSGRGFQFDAEKYLLEAGLNLKAATPPGFRYGLTWAGTIPYYADGRRPVDLLGKMDRVIAHSKPEPGTFKPGHNKYDLNYSIGQLHPDAMLQPPDDLHGDPGMEAKVAKWGYVTTPGGWWILAKSETALVDTRILKARFWWDDVLPPLGEQLAGSRPVPPPAAAIAPAVEEAAAVPVVIAAKTGHGKSAPPRTIGNPPQRAMRAH